jgi:predicted nucleic acid-binding protein
VRGFLLDTNHVEAYCRKDPKVIARLRAIPAEWPIRVCAITLGEIEAGHLITTTTDQAKRDDFIRCINEDFSGYALKISLHTRHKYAKIISGLLHNDPKTNPDTKTEKHLVLVAGVDINDVWTVASAWEHKLTLATTDKMTKIRNVVENRVQFDNWLV